MTEDHI